MSTLFKHFTSLIFNQQFISINNQKFIVSKSKFILLLLFFFYFFCSNLIYRFMMLLLCLNCLFFKNLMEKYQKKIFSKKMIYFYDHRAGKTKGNKKLTVNRSK